MRTEHGAAGAGWSRGGGRQEPPPADDAPAWISGAVPDDWFTGTPEIDIDRDEIVIVGRLPAPTLSQDASDADRAAAEQGRIASFREASRDRRMAIARQLEHRYKRKVGWGAVAGGTRELFTTLSAPVMTRLRQPDRQVLDTLVASGVARSRSDALAWCVSLVGQHADAWLGELRGALGAVDELRRRGPAL
ncbi:hypothetical protein HC028_10420 [Planosporangium flavigriseum]|uniref:Smu12A n=1 Tax=Planosporangium flavigriseum TaxID=373681 RepID=A0A8J3LG92_9ACTN|nr:hypothetical protein [Planosporangium flavigriseum]NJC64913.1 hypothetical protein [Planosporangium flavigriseum]GIG72788.1 hypothetical protein Pfl04_11920 [Planosporangium flavigriseum]